MLDKKITKLEIFELIKDLFAKDGKEINVNSEMLLIGIDSEFDSMNLVALGMALEDKATDMGFEFDWTSDFDDEYNSTSMSESSNMFRTAGTLIEEFIKQSMAKT